MRVRPRLSSRLLIAAVCLVGVAWAEESRNDPPVDITLEVFSDFECPFCRQFAIPVRNVQTKGVDDLNPTVTFKHFPLEFHANADLAAQAAEAAREQGKFWEMHDLIFAHQDALGRADLIGHAETLQLDVERFQADLDSDRIKQVVHADKTEGDRRGVRGTPTFFVNGKLYSGTKTYEELIKILRDEKARVRALLEVPETSLSKGPSDAAVTLEFFADLESPVSKPAMTVVDQVVSRYPSSVRVQFRNFPLAFHPNAAMAHAAAMVVAREGRFWEFATYILARQDSLREQDLIAYAGELGIDQEKFAAAILDRRYAPRVDADVTAGFGRGIRGSPVIFVNEKRIDGVPSLETLVRYVEEELAAIP